jgi:hypothetical protein
MAIDLTDDINAQIRLSQSIGRGVGSFISNQRAKQRAEEAAELKKIQQQETLRIMSGQGTPEEKLRMLNDMPGSVNNKLVQRMNEKALDRQLMGGNQNQSQKVAELDKLQKIYEKTQTTDTITGETTTIPGMEQVAAGTQARIRQLSKELFATGDPLPQEPETIGELIEQKRQEREQKTKFAEGIGAGARTVTGRTKQELDRNTAIAILKEAGGDKQRAREIATERGFKF